MSDSIKVIKRDGSFYESNGVISVNWVANQLIILCNGLMGIIDSTIIDGIEIESFCVTRGA